MEAVLKARLAGHIWQLEWSYEPGCPVSRGSESARDPGQKPCADASGDPLGNFGKLQT